MCFVFVFLFLSSGLSKSFFELDANACCVLTSVSVSCQSVGLPSRRLSGWGGEVWGGGGGVWGGREGCEVGVRGGCEVGVHVLRVLLEKRLLAALAVWWLRWRGKRLLTPTHTRARARASWRVSVGRFVFRRPRPSPVKPLSVTPPSALAPAVEFCRFFLGGRGYFSFLCSC